MLRAIVTDFHLLKSEEVFKLRLHQWRHAEEYGSVLWNAVKVLVEGLERELVGRHAEVLEKQRNARVHKYIVAQGLTGITGVRLKVTPQEPTAPIEAAVEAVQTADDIRTEVVPQDFYAGSPTKGKSKGSKRRAEESSERAVKRRKTLVSIPDCCLSSTDLRRKKMWIQQARSLLHRAERDYDLLRTVNGPLAGGQRNNNSRIHIL